jgi:uncharacterized damage-inducible protein DinB
MALCSLMALPAVAQSSAGASSGQGSGSGASGSAGSGQATAAQAAPTDPLAAFVKGAFKSVSGYLVGSAEKMPEDNFGKKLGTQPETRTYAQMLGHLINANYFFCSQAKGEESPQTVDYEKTLQTKDALVKAMHAAIDYCQPVYAALTDASLTSSRTVTGQNGQSRQVFMFTPILRNVAHNNEEYGNIVGYFRSFNLVPPSTEAAAAQQGGRRGN